MKEKILSVLKKEIHIPIPDFIKNNDRINFVLQEIPKKREIAAAAKTLTQKQKITFWTLVSVFLLSSLAIIWKTNDNLMVEVPATGGTLTEGIADVPRFINPLLITGEADRDIAMLVYSGLLRAQGDGKYLPDLAESYSISPDGLTYTFKIRDNAYWHDGRRVTSDDIEFTIEKTKDPILRSPKRASWEGVEVEKVSEKKVVFHLKQPYSSFLETATMGILPKHNWENVETKNWIHNDLNLKGVGTGPYKVKYVKKQNTQEALPEYMELTPFSKFVLGTPHLEEIVLRFYPNREKLVKAFESGEIDSMNSISPQKAVIYKGDGYRIEEVEFPTTYAIFFNSTDSPVLADVKTRQALDVAIDKEKIVKEVLQDYGSPLYGPVPPGSLGFVKSPAPVATSSDAKIDEAKKILVKNGWIFNGKTGVLEKKVKNKPTIAMEFTFATPDIQEIKKIADMIKESWEKLGAKITVKIYEKGDLDKNVIQPRKYDALLFGEILGREPDLFSFWHSSQRNYPGVNITMYANSIADKILDGIRNESDQSKKIKLIGDLQKEIIKDMPASFIYAPHFIYSLPSNIKGVKLIPPVTSSDRFLNVYEWYIGTEKIWKVFNH